MTIVVRVRCLLLQVLDHLVDLLCHQVVFMVPVVVPHVNDHVSGDLDCDTDRALLLTAAVESLLFRPKEE